MTWILTINFFIRLMIDPRIRLTMELVQQLPTQRNESTNPLSSNFHNFEMLGNTFFNSPGSNNDISNSNINIVSLNNAILSLTKNIEFIYNFVRSAYSPSSDASTARFTLPNANRE